MHHARPDQPSSAAEGCGHQEFELSTRAMLSVDLSGAPSEHTIWLDGLDNDTTSLTCKKCHRRAQPDKGTDNSVTDLLVALELKLGVALPDVPSYSPPPGAPEDAALSRRGSASASRA